MKLVTNKFKSGGLHEKHVVANSTSDDICDNEYVVTTKRFLLKNEFLLKLV